MRMGSKLVQAIFNLLNVRGVVRRGFLNPPRNARTMDVAKFDSRLTPRAWSVDGFKLVTLHEATATYRHVVFFHGGAYIMGANAFHRKFMETLARDHGLAVTFVDYPKAPEHTFHTTHEVVLKAYREIARRYPGHSFSLLGDSAGGGLALALLQTLRDEGVQPFPEKTVLLSPWLDLSMSNPDIREYEARDHLLPLEGLRYAAERYSGGEDLGHPRLSPLRGDLSNLGAMLMVCGTNEVLLPDCLALVEKVAGAQGSTIDCIIAEGMMHDWVIFPFAESRRAVGQIAQFLLADC